VSEEAKAAKEVAEDDFARMAEWYDLDLEGLDKEDATAFNTLKDAIVREICRGRIVVCEKGFPTVRLKYPVGSIAEITFKHPHGQHLIAAGDKKAKNAEAQGWKMMADLTGMPDTTFSNMRINPDYRNCKHLVALFLG
jgi:hypothetical protein